MEKVPQYNCDNKVLLHDHSREVTLPILELQSVTED